MPVGWLRGLRVGSEGLIGSKGSLRVMDQFLSYNTSSMYDLVSLSCFRTSSSDLQGMT